MSPNPSATPSTPDDPNSPTSTDSPQSPPGPTDAPSPTPSPTGTPLVSAISFTLSSLYNALVKNPKYVPNPKYYLTASSSSSTAAASASATNPSSLAAQGCFPGNGLAVPTNSPASAAVLKQWWCSQDTEYGFMGFSYDQTPCQSLSTLTADFKRMKSQFNARYVRLYGACDSAGYNDNLVEAASQARIGIYGLVWFGFDGDDMWKTRMAGLVSTIKNNVKAPYIFRNIAVGSEPLFDWVMSADDLAVQVNNLRSQLSYYGIQTTISEMPYGFQSQGDAPAVFKAIDLVEGNVLPFFDGSATTGGNAWGVVSWSISYFQSKAPGKVIRLTQTGWPSNQNVWKANTASAVASVSSEKAYFNLLDSKCTTLKGWGVGWFAQIWSDDMLDGWGILDWNGNPKFTFAPKTAC
ncbi:hypothetical protein T439DRAFT_293419 [Meredithblackwellia eburnea MCA 4105]